MTPELDPEERRALAAQMARDDLHLYRYALGSDPPVCATCWGDYRDPSHVQHARGMSCKDNYGHGSKSCAACAMQAQEIVATGCTSDPYAATCGHAMSGGSKCGGKCGRGDSTD